jgi:hypothetical protein
MTSTTMVARHPPEAAQRPLYDFDSLRHGDAIWVASKPSAREMFRRWKRAKGRRGRLVSAKDNPKVLYFLDETPV